MGRTPPRGSPALSSGQGASVESTPGSATPAPGGPEHSTWGGRGAEGAWQAGTPAAEEARPEQERMRAGSPRGDATGHTGQGSVEENKRVVTDLGWNHKQVVPLLRGMLQAHSRL